MPAAGGPNSNDSNSNKLLHHTIGLLDREQELRCFQQVTCAQVHTLPQYTSTLGAHHAVRRYDLLLFRPGNSSTRAVSVHRRSEAAHASEETVCARLMLLESMATNASVPALYCTLILTVYPEL